MPMFLMLYFTLTNYDEGENDKTDPNDGEILGGVVEEVVVQEEGHDDGRAAVHQSNLKYIKTASI
jgi:hypothetical protein